MRVGTVLLLACALLVGCGGPVIAQRPNVIVLVIDTLRPDHLDLYGYPRETAPFLARVGAQSGVFESAFSSSTWTAPSTASLFTGIYPLRHGVTLGFHAHRRQAEEIEASGRAAISINQLPANRPVLPEVLHEQGYRSFGIASNVNIGPVIGFDRGFDRFLNLNQADAEVLDERLAEWEPEARAAERFLLYVHLNDVHAPYEPRAPWYEQAGNPRADDIAAYDSEIRYVDGVLERILARFDPEGEALLVVVSDHGEEFWEHGHGHHTHSLHYELAHILLMIRAPALGVVAAQHGENVSIVDVLPTLLDLLAIPAPDALDGTSLAPLLRGGLGAVVQQRALAERPLLSHRASPVHDYELRGVVKGRWHLIDDGRNPRLFDLERDRLEQQSVTKQNPEVVETLRAHLAEADAERTRDEKVEVPLDREGLEQLRALGYVEE